MPNKVFLVAERANLSATALFSLVNFDTVAYRVKSVRFLGPRSTLSIHSDDLPLILEPSQSTQLRVVYTPNGDTNSIFTSIVVDADKVISGEVDSVTVPLEASIGPAAPIDTIRLISKRSAGLEPNTVRFVLILDSDLDDRVGFAEATFRYRPNELYLGNYAVLSDSIDDDGWEYTGLRVVPDNKRLQGDTIADFHFTILHGSTPGGDTNSVLDLIRVEWFAKFTGNHIYTHTIVDSGVVSGVTSQDYQTSERVTLSVFPNPADEFLNVVVSNANDVYKLSLYSSEGFEMLDLTPLVTNAAANSSFTTSTSLFPRGAYFLHAVSKAGSIAYPIVLR